MILKQSLFLLVFTGNPETKYFQTFCFNGTTCLRRAQPQKLESIYDLVLPELVSFQSRNLSFRTDTEDIRIFFRHLELQKEQILPFKRLEQATRNLKSWGRAC